MARIELFDEAHFEQAKTAYHNAVLSTAEIGQICSRQEWLLSAKTHLHQSQGLKIARLNDSWLCLCKTELPSGEVLYHALETVWGFSCPLIGDDQEEKLELLRKTIDSLDARTLLLLTGIVEGSNLARAAMDFFGSGLDWLPQNVSSLIANLEPGLDEYLSRRPSVVRKSINSFSKKAKTLGIEFEFNKPEDDPSSLFQRLLEIEARSWKSHEGASIFQSPEYREFYRDLLRRCHENGILCLLFAKNEEEDLAYCFGARFAKEYRGFQMSFDKKARALGLGNGLQWQMIQHCFLEGVTRYDFGMFAEYKLNWADEERRMLSGVIRRSLV